MSTLYVHPSGIETCECGHECLMHYLRDDGDEYAGDEYAGCIESDCDCLKYRARTLKKEDSNG